MNLRSEANIFIGKETHRRRHSGLLEHPIIDSKTNPSVDNEKVKKVSLRRRSLDCAQKSLNKNTENHEKRRKSWEFKQVDCNINDELSKASHSGKRRSIFKRNVDLNITYLDEIFFPVIPDVHNMSQQGTKNKNLKHHWNQNNVYKRKTQIDNSGNTRKGYKKNEMKKSSTDAIINHKGDYNLQNLSIAEDVIPKKSRNKTRSYRQVRKNSDNFNTTFIEEAENEKDLGDELKGSSYILENVDTTNFESPSFLEKAINKKRHDKNADDFNQIREYYLNNAVKTKSSNLETIFEVPKRDSYMTFRKYRRFIDFDEFNNRARIKKRQFKAIKTNSTIFKMDNCKVEELELLLEKLSDIDA